MNKTVTINISGIIFHIEEDAYEKLGNYLKTIRNRFTVEDGRDEIMMDIESRIAEILQGKTGPSKQVVLLADVDYVISLMGEPEVISENEEKKEENSSKEEQTHATSSGRKRLYRDTDDKVVGGVCSGLGYYFDLDPVWIRVGFAVIFFAFGTGLLFYILLMIIIPKAITTSEKLEMRGEPVDINNISKSFKEDFGGFKKKAEDFGEEMKSRGKKWKQDAKEWNRNNRTRGGFENFFHGVFRVMGRLFAFFLIFFGILFLIGLLTSTFALSDFGSATIGSNIKNLFSSGFNYFLAITAILLVFGIPILMMIYKGIRLMFRINKKDRIIGITALSLWGIGIILLIISIVGIAKGFSEDERVHEDFAFQNTHAKTLFLNVKIDHDMENEDYNSKFNRRHHYMSRYKAVSINGGSIKFGFPELQILPSDNDSNQLIIYKYASGSNKREAQDRAKAIEYHITQKDSLLTFNSFFTMGENQHWRAQRVRMELHIPIGTIVQLSGNMSGIIDGDGNLSDALDEDMAGRRWKMTSKGLQCIDCAGLETSQNFNEEGFPKPQKNDSSVIVVKKDSIVIGKK